MAGNLLLVHGGGPTAVINASAYGVIKTALANPNITKVYGAHHGIKGVLNDQLMIMDEEDPAELELMLGGLEEIRFSFDLVVLNESIEMLESYISEIK